MDIPKFFEIQCPNCHLEYRIPIEHCGMDAVCCDEKCGAMFMIPTLKEFMMAEEIREPDVPRETVSTDTVKISRRNIGMKPDQKKQDGLDTSNYVILPNNRPQKKKRIFRI